MKKIFLALLVILIVGILNTYSQSKEADAVLGKWLTEENESVIEIYKKDNKYYGKLIWLEEPNDEDGNPKLDKKNPISAFRQQPILGMAIMFNFEYLGDNRWEEGKIYDPQSGNTYNCKLTLVGNNTLNARGYLGFSVIGRTTTWTRKLD